MLSVVCSRAREKALRLLVDCAQMGPTGFELSLMEFVDQGSDQSGDDRWSMNHGSHALQERGLSRSAATRGLGLRVHNGRSQFLASIVTVQTVPADAGDTLRRIENPTGLPKVSAARSGLSTGPTRTGVNVLPIRPVATSYLAAMEVL